MASTLCEVKLIGRLGKDGELKDLKSGNSMLVFSLATDTYNSATRESEPMWHQCAMFPSNYGDDPMKRIDALAPYLVKGKQVYISGTFNYWEREDGSKQPSIKVSEVIFLGKKDDIDTSIKKDGSQDTASGDNEVPW